MFAILSLLSVLTLSILVTRIATVALTHTGLSREASRFQARSAFTGVGFTTSESEKVVNHPVRRRVLLLLMLLGNAGVVGAMSSLLLAFVQGGGGGFGLALKIVLLVSGLVVLWAVASSRWVDRRLSRWVDRLLSRYTRLDVQDYASLLHLGGDYRVAELQVQDQDWLAGRTLAELQLREEGLLVLGVTAPEGSFLGAPGGSTSLRGGDTVLLYGRTAGLAALDERRRGRAGDAEHRRAVRDQRAVRSRERRVEAARERDPSPSGDPDAP